MFFFVQWVRGFAEFVIFKPAVSTSYLCSLDFEGLKT
jgi:hypothetical protein